MSRTVLPGVFASAFPHIGTRWINLSSSPLSCISRREAGLSPELRYTFVNHASASGGIKYQDDYPWTCRQGSGLTPLAADFTTVPAMSRFACAVLIASKQVEEYVSPFLGMR